MWVLISGVLFNMSNVFSFFVVLVCDINGIGFVLFCNVLCSVEKLFFCVCIFKVSDIEKIW